MLPEQSPPESQPPEYREQSAKTRTFLIAGGIVGSAALFMILVCGGLIWFRMGRTQDLTGVQTIADAFLDDLGAGRIEQAYDRTTAGFRKSASLEQFRALIEHYEPLHAQKTRSYSAVYIAQQRDGLQGIVRGSVIGVDQTVHVALAMQIEDDQWKIQLFLVE